MTRATRSEAGRWLLVGLAVAAAIALPFAVRDQYVLHVFVMWGIYAVLTRVACAARNALHTSVNRCTLG